MLEVHNKNKTSYLHIIFLPLILKCCMLVQPEMFSLAWEPGSQISDNFKACVNPLDTIK